MISTGDLIILGINAGLKLAEQGRKAYVEGTMNRELVLPLPDFDSSITVSVAKNYFMGSKHLEDEEKLWLKALYEKVAHGTAEEKDDKDFIAAYKELKFLDDLASGEASAEETALSKEALLSMVRVRQWARGRSPYPDALQRVAGTLIQVGMDYFANTPGALNENSTTGRALKGFLCAVDELDFAQTRVDAIAKGMFVAALESIRNNPSLLGGDDKTEKMVEAISKGLISDIQERTKVLAEKDLTKQQRIETWGQLVFRSMLSNAGTLVLSNPGLYLGVREPGRQAMVSLVGTSIMDALIDEESIDLAGLYSRDTLDRLVRAALVALTEHPELAGVDHKGLKKIIGQVAKDLAESAKILGPDVLPEIARLVFEKSARNMDLLWPEEFRDDPAKHLLVSVSKELFECLSKPPGDQDKWKPRFTKTQLVEIAESVLDEVVQNPGWLEKKAGQKHTLLGEAVERTLEVLKTVPAARISPDTGTRILKAVIRAAALRKEFLSKVKVGDKEKEALSIVLEILADRILLDTVDHRARWILAREEVFSRLAESILERLTVLGASAENIMEIDDILKKAIHELRSGKPWRLESVLSDLKAMPD